MLEQLWNAGFTVAAHLLNKCWRDSMGVLPDDEQAELWFRRAAEAGHDFSQYALGKLLQSQKRMDEAVSRYEKAAAQDNSYADCWLGKLYFEGKAVSKDVPPHRLRRTGQPVRPVCSGQAVSRRTGGSAGPGSILGLVLCDGGTGKQVRPVLPGALQ